MTTKIPRYRQVVEQLREEIVSGRAAPGSRLPSLLQLQARFDIARGTGEKVCEELKKEGLIVRRRGSGTFVAPPPRPSSTGLIGFVGTAALARQTFYHAPIAQGIEEAVRRAGRQLVLLDGDSPGGWEHPDGVLMYYFHHPESLLRHLPAGTPCVSLLTPTPGYSSVLADDFGGAGLAVEHLVSLGHRRIACLMEPNSFGMFGMRTRIAGYWAALRDCGIEPLPEWIYHPVDDAPVKRNYRQWAHENVSTWLRSGWADTGCTALLVQNDVAAIGAIQALVEGGYEVPEQVSVVGFDSTDICNAVKPRITSVALPFEQIAVAGVELLLEQIEGKVQGVRSTVLPTTLDVRQSTGPPPVVLSRQNMDGFRVRKPAGRRASGSKVLEEVAG